MKVLSENNEEIEIREIDEDIAETARELELSIEGQSTRRGTTRVMTASELQGSGEDDEEANPNEEANIEPEEGEDANLDSDVGDYEDLDWEQKHRMNRAL